jgi:hypothetical protein
MSGKVANLTYSRGHRNHENLRALQQGCDLSKVPANVALQ